MIFDRNNKENYHTWIWMLKVGLKNTLSQHAAALARHVFKHLFQSNYRFHEEFCQILSFDWTGLFNCKSLNLLEVHHESLHHSQQWYVIRLLSQYQVMHITEVCGLLHSSHESISKCTFLIIACGIKSPTEILWGWSQTLPARSLSLLNSTQHK